MTYSRREVVDNETVVDKDHYDNLQDGIDEALKGNQDAKAYTDQQIALVTSTGIPKLVVEVQPIVAESEGQTEFEIALSTYDEKTDTLLFYSGLTKLSPNKDYTVEGNKVILNRGLPLGRTGDIYIFKNVPMGEDGSVSGKVLAPGTVPLDRIIDSNLKTYTSLEQIGITIGEETIDSIMSALPNNSKIMLGITSAYNTSQYPNMNGIFIAHKHHQSRTSLTFESANLGKRWFAEHYNTGTTFTWTGWKEIFTTEGGTLSDALSISTMQSGSVVTQRLFPMIEDIGNSYVVGIERLVNGVGESAFQFNRSGARIKDISANKYYNLFGEHNKPSGSYTGNGSTAKRSIAVGGLYRGLLYVYSDYGVSLVTPQGAICIASDGTVTGIGRSAVSYSNDGYAIASTNKFLNENGKEYTYRVV